jgi:alanyl-tRNA synthetase
MTIIKTHTQFTADTGIITQDKRHKTAMSNLKKKKTHTHTHTTYLEYGSLEIELSPLSHFAWSDSGG